MALHSAPTWSHELIQGGKSPNTPVALIRHCSLPDQEVLFCELSQVPQTLTQNPKFTPPVLVVIGDVLRAKHLPPTPASPSKSSLPLASENILVTSPIEPTDRLPQALRTLGANVIVQPAIEILPANPEPILSIIDQLDQFDSLVFSSRHGVHHFLSLLMNSSRDARALAHLKIAAVGHATAQALMEFGLRADWCPTHNAGADALLDQWLPHAADQRILLIQTPTGKSTLQTTLQPICKSITPLDVYLQSPVPKWPTSLSTNLPRNTIVTATSSNIATESFRLLGPIAKELRWLSISQAVSETLTKLGAKQVYTAANPSYDGICQASLTIAKRLEE
jgi:uroporphyrinogen III methyltransferase/synthase